jgi:hypothetical protein
MVNDRGQLYTIEAVAAGLIMILAAYFAVSSTSVYTPGDAHISDMQLEVIGTDALRMMDIPPNSSVRKSPLQQIIEGHNSPNDASAVAFGELFNRTINNRTSLSKYDRVQFNASYVWRSETLIPANEYTRVEYINSSRFLAGGEHPVRVTKWVIVETRPPTNIPSTSLVGQRAVLLEVLLWRD